MKNPKLILILVLFISPILSGNNRAEALPPPEDIPEEILRTQIITEARSPYDGSPLTAAEYAEIQARLEERGFAPEVSPKIRHLIFLLGLRKFLRTVTPL
ncbi:MAG: hypothetical protein ACFBSE_13100 [Prochloraceae cyanobacterium]